MGTRTTDMTPPLLAAESGTAAVPSAHADTALVKPAQSRRMLLVGMICTILASATLFILIDNVLLVLWSTSIGYPSFGLHPFLMTLSFGVFMPLAALSYAGLERIFSVAHSTAKHVHATCMLAALVMAIIGVVDMYIVHQNAKGGAFHFISVHSWVGIMVVVATGLQWLSGLGIFYWPSSPGWLRRAWLPTHVALGMFSLFGGLASIALGILSVGYKHGGTPASYHTREQVEWQVAGLMCGFVALGLAIVFASLRKSQ